MSERRPEAVPVAFRVIERDAVQTADVLAWLAPASDDVRPVEFAHRSASPRAWIPRQVGERDARRHDGAGGRGEESPEDGRDNARVANVPVARAASASAANVAPSSTPISGAASLPVANVPVANVPVANVPVANVPVANVPVDEPPRAVDGLEGEPRSDTHALRPSLAPSNEAPPLATGPSANERPSLAAPAVPAALIEATEALATARTELLAHAEGELVELAVEIARSILGAELESRPELHRALVRAGLELLGGETTPRVRLSPESFDAILTATGSRTIEAHGQRIELEPDPSVRGAGALLDAGSASVDGRLDTRLERVRAALLVARRGGVIGEAA
jgi:hypothetical protein